ncbi:amidase [Arthrobacter crystallopoietes]|uniref:amidase n=1 Tax=Crystallibacter crystallopoietes TaxID=37928 RepID=UPI001ABE2D8D|nr:amidase [Arthrobacter crystallopoietes]QTG81456.1 amidase [Arthrobacter crystallopoietes]
MTTETTTTALADFSAVELLQGYKAREISPVEATAASLARIKAHNAEFNAFCLVAEDEALAAARESEQRWAAGKPAGPLDGVPTSIKDLLLTKGWPTLRGSKLINPDQEWNEDAPAVAAMRAAGAVFVGKTTTPEFGWKGVTDNPLTGITGNPWDASKTCGGSSGGSATAVALGMGALSVGTDGGGSVRIPASFSGIVGMKPTYGTIPLYPPTPYGTLAHAGPMTRTVQDNALLLDVLAASDSRDWSALAPPRQSFTEGLYDGIKGLRMGFSPDLGFATVDPEVERLVARAVDLLATLGAEVETADPGIQDPINEYHALWFAGAGKVIRAYDEARWGELDPGLLEVCRQGHAVTVDQYLDANAVRANLGLRLGAFHEQYDLLVTPTMPIPAFDVGCEVPPGSGLKRWAQWSPFTYPFNMTQQPAISVPCGLTASGLPVGLQIVGPRHADALVLRAAAAYEQARGEFGRPPALATGERRE